METGTDSLNLPRLKAVLTVNKRKKVVRMCRVKNEKGVMLIASAFLVTVLTATSAMFLSRSLNEYKMTNREIDRLSAYCAAEAGFQGALAQVGSNGYTGFINNTTYNAQLDVDGNTMSTCSATISSDTMDFVIIRSTGTASFTSRTIEARVFLESNLSKYLVYTTASAFGSGTNAQYGEPMRDEDDIDNDGDTTEYIVDSNGRYRVPKESRDRAAMYFTGDWVISGTGVKMFGDVYVNDDLVVYSRKDVDVYGDTYVRDQYATSGSLNVDDTYNDGPDKRVMTNDMQETLTPIDTNFYAAHNSIPAFGNTSGSRYLKFEVSANGTHTVVKEYSDKQYSTLINTYDIPETGVVYVNGDVYVKGTIKGRVSVVASDDIFFQGDVEYANGLKHADISDSAAFIAKDKLYYCAPVLDVCGIFYGAKTYSSSPAFDARYDTNGRYNPYSKQYLRIRGNRIINGTTNLGYYPDRAYIYDPYLKKFRPPGLPITSVVSFVREV